MSALWNSSCVQLGVPVIDRISEAVRNGDEETFRKLISLFRFYEAANLNQLDSRGSHPLHMAVAFKRQKMLKTLLHYRNSLRLEVNITDAHGLTALEIAVRTKNHTALEKLLKHDCSLDSQVLDQLKQQLYVEEYCSLGSDEREVEGSCRSEISMLHHYHTPHPTETMMPGGKHLLHPISGTHWSGEICEKAVRKCYHSLTRYMEPTYIITLLVEAGHFSPDHVSQILSHQTKTEQALQLLALLHRCGGAAYQGLFKALKEETEHKAHQELLQQLEKTCESLVNSGYESASQEFLEEVTTVYHGDDMGTPVLDRSIELSDRTESGIYSATPTAMQGTHSSGKMSTPSRRTSSQSSRKKSITLTDKKPNVTMRGRVNKRACTNFRAPDEPQPRSSLHVINTVVKRDSTPVQATTNDSNTYSSTCLVTGTGCQTPLHTLQPVPDLLDSVSFLIASSEQEEDDVIEKDASIELPNVSSLKSSAPIDIPSRNTSCATSAQSSAQDSASVSSRDCRSPRAVQMMRQSSTDTTSSDSNSSDSSYIRLDIAPNCPKDLSHIPPAIRRSWKKAFVGFIEQCRTRLNYSAPSGTETVATTSSSRSGTRGGGPSYVMGYGMRM